MANKKKVSVSPKKKVVSSAAKAIPAKEVETNIVAPVQQTFHMGQYVKQWAKARDYTATTFASQFNKRRSWSYKLYKRANLPLKLLLLLSEFMQENLLLRIPVNVPVQPSAAEEENAQLKLRLDELERQTARCTELEKENLQLQTRVDELHIVLKVK